MGSKLSNSIFKPKKVEAETTASTPCEATTSHQDDKACSSSSSSIVTSKPKAMTEHEDGDADDEEERRREKKHKKKKKKKKYYDEEKDEKEDGKKQSKSKEVSLAKEEEEDVVRRVKHSSFNPDIVAKKWDEKPDMKSIGRSNTWDGSKSSSLLDELRKGQEIRSWSGDRSALEKGGGEVRKRSAEEDQDAEMDRGKTKKVKKHRDEGEAYRGGRNPFQAAQNMSNRGEKFSRGKEERRSWGDERRGDDRKYSKGGDRSWSRGGE